MKFLTNENISPLTVEFLRKIGCEVKSVKEAGLKGASDAEIIAFAISEGRAIITLDLDYGEMYYFASSANLCVIILRLRSQWYENVNLHLQSFLKTGRLETAELNNSLIVLSEGRCRIRTKQKPR